MANIAAASAIRATDAFLAAARSPRLWVEDRSVLERSGLRPGAGAVVTVSGSFRGVARIDSNCSAARGDDRLHQAGDDVVDVAGDGDARGNRGCRAQAVDVASDCGCWVEDRVVAQA